jgi:hypothetical protein
MGNQQSSSEQQEEKEQETQSSILGKALFTTVAIGIPKK